MHTLIIIIIDEKCVDSCSTGFYFSDIKQRCDQCHSMCKTCFGPHPDQCNSCNNGIHLEQVCYDYISLILE